MTAIHLPNNHEQTIHSSEGRQRKLRGSAEHGLPHWRHVDGPDQVGHVGQEDVHGEGGQDRMDGGAGRRTTPR